MIERAEESGRLKPGYTIVESSTGNTATSLAFVGAVKGYKVKIFSSEDSLTDEKRKTLTRYGAQFETRARMLPGEAGVAGEVVEWPGRIKCKELEKRDLTVWWARQFSNRENVLAHSNMGIEILKQLNAKVDVWISSIGTGGNFMGVAKALKERNPRLRCVAVEPTGWAGHESILSGWKSGAKKVVPDITGGIVKQIVDDGIVDEIVQVSNEDARNMAYRLSREEGMFCGISTGANVFAAMNEAKKLGLGKNVVTVAVDSGDRYFSDERYIT